MTIKGDGTDLCCLVNPIRRHKKCTLSFCNDHWWDHRREEENFKTLPQLFKAGSKCPRCNKKMSLDGSDLQADMWHRLDR